MGALAECLAQLFAGGEPQHLGRLVGELALRVGGRRIGAPMATTSAATSPSSPTRRALQSAMESN